MRSVLGGEVAVLVCCTVSSVVVRCARSGRWGSNSGPADYEIACELPSTSTDVYLCRSWCRCRRLWAALDACGSQPELQPACSRGLGACSSSVAVAATSRHPRCERVARRLMPVAGGARWPNGGRLHPAGDAPRAARPACATWSQDRSRASAQRLPVHKNAAVTRACASAIQRRPDDRPRGEPGLAFRSPRRAARAPADLL